MIKTGSCYQIYYILLVRYTMMSRDSRGVPYHAHPCFDAVQINTRYHF